jgi:hypothetical protein
MGASVTQPSVMIGHVIDRAVRIALASSSTTSVVVLVAFNLLPLAGVLFWGWSVATILVLYWVENGIVGALNVPKMLLASAPEPGVIAQGRIDRVAMASKIGQVGFYLVHYGIFWFVHGIFVFTLPMFIGLGSAAGDPGFFEPGAFDPGGFPVPGVVSGDGSVVFLGIERSGPDLGAVGWAALGLAISHGVSFVVNFVGRREYLRVTTAQQMFAPYGRLVILHVTIILGAILSLSIGSPVGAIVVLVILKTVVDLGFHLREHGRAIGPTQFA